VTALNWDHLQTFLAVARHGRLSSAAAKLGTDHTTLARRITTLEQALNAKLFERRSTGYSLTAEGSTLLLFADSIDRLTQRAFETIGGSASAVEGAVRLAVPEGFGSYFLASRVGKLATIHPRLSVQLVFGGGAYSLTKRETDILVTVTRPTEGRLFMRKLVDYDLGLFATAQYLAANPAIEDRADLPQHRFVGYIEDLLQSPELDYLGEIHLPLR
jgi:DNA-binding transcriptional LysR family regulator